MSGPPALRRPMPAPSPLTQPFWDAAREHRLVIQRCRTCRTYYHPPVPECFHCLASGDASTLRFEPVSGRGVIYTCTKIHTTRMGGFEGVTPYPLVYVALEEQPGLILCCNMPGTSWEELRVGAPVEVMFADYAGATLPEFRLARPPAAGAR